MSHFSRRSFFKAAGIGALGATAGMQPLMPSATKPSAKELTFYVGTYTRNRTEGIFVCRFNADTGAITVVRGVTGDNPSFLAVDNSQRFLYAANEIGEFNGKQVGSVTAYTIDRETGDLEMLNQVAATARGPVHLVVDRGNRHVLVANYSGSVSVFPIMEDGRLGEASEHIAHQGSGPVEGRQRGPHAHSIYIDHSNQWVVSPDLGIDKLMIYRFDPEQGKLTPGPQPFATVPPGAGPRHFAFHPGSRWAYLINEMNATVTSFAFDPAKGTFTEIQTITTLPPEGFSEQNWTADIRVHSSGRFVYGTNRGHDSMVVYEVGDNGHLTPIQWEPTQGDFPRNFALDPTGQYLMVANQNSNNIVVMSIDQQTGKLTPTGHSVEIPMPVCIRFALPHP